MAWPKFTPLIWPGYALAEVFVNVFVFMKNSDNMKKIKLSEDILKQKLN